METKYDGPEPILYLSGKIIFNDQFKHEPEFIKIIPFLDKDVQKAQDLGIYIYFVHSNKSIYRNTPEEDREKLLFRDGRIVNKKWLTSFIKTEKASALIDKYCLIAKTPGERLWFGMVENINRYLAELSTVRGDDSGIDHISLVKKGKGLFESLKSIESMMSEESRRKVRAGYRPRKFERRNEERRTAA